MELKCSKRMYELSEEMKSLTSEARVLQKNGDIAKAKEKVDKLHELKAEYETEKELFETEKLFQQPQGSAKSIPGTTANQEEEGAFYKAFRNRFNDYNLNKSLMSEGSDANGGFNSASMAFGI